MFKVRWGSRSRLCFSSYSSHTFLHKIIEALSSAKVTTKRKVRPRGDTCTKCSYQLIMKRSASCFRLSCAHESI